MSRNTPEKLDDFCVTPEDYAQNFDDGGIHFERYNELFNFLSEADPADRCGGGYAKFLGYSRRGPFKKEYSTVCRKTNSILSLDERPLSIKALMELYNFGLFDGDDAEVCLPCKNYDSNFFNSSALNPITRKSPYFDLLTFICSVRFWGGNSMRSGTDTSVCYAVLARDNDEISSVLIPKLRQMGWLNNHDLLNKKYKNRDGFLKGSISRLLCFFDQESPQKKRNRPHPFPKIIELAYNTLLYSEDENERTHAYNILRDFVNLFFVLRGGIRKDRNYLNANLKSHRSPEIALMQAEMFMDILKTISFPEVRMNKRLIKLSSKDEPSSFGHRVCIPTPRPHLIHFLSQEIRNRATEILQ